MEQIKDTTLEPGDCTTSYGITALFTSVPVATVVKVVQNRLDQDQELHFRKKFTVQHIIELFGFCLHNTYVIFKGKYYEQIEGGIQGIPSKPHHG